MTDAAPRPVPVSLRLPAERHAHVAQRLLERGGITWDVARVAALEAKIKFVRNQINLGKVVPHILPTKIGQEFHNQNHYYRVWVDGKTTTFVWSQVARGLISFRGMGELGTPVHPAPVSPKPLPASDPVAGFHAPGQPGSVGPGGDLSGCST